MRALFGVFEIKQIQIYGIER